MSHNNEEIPLEPVGCHAFGHPIDQEVANRVFLIESATGEEITFGQLEQQTHALASGLLSSIHLEEGDILAFFSESTIKVAVAISASLLLGLPYTPVPPANGPFEVFQMVEDTRARVLFVDLERVPVIQRLMDDPQWKSIFERTKVVVLDDAITSTHGESFFTYGQLVSKHHSARVEHVPHFAVGLDSFMLIVHTSGSTGKPKGACHTHRSIMSNLIQFGRAPSMQEYKDLTMMLAFPFGHVSGTILMLTSMLQRTTTVIINYNDLSTMFDVIKRYRVGRIFGANNVMIHLVQNRKPEHDLSSLKMALTAGSKFPEATARALVEECKIKIVECYGSTEFLFISASTNEKGTVPSNVGPVIPGIELKIRNLSNDEAVPQGESGEVCLRGVYCFTKYLHKPEQTAEAIDSNGWFHTGDVGFVDAQGNLHITDRIKEIIKFKGWSVFPAEIECFLATHPAVRGSVVVAVKHSQYNYVPRAYIALKPGFDNVSIDQLKQYVADSMGYQRRLRGGIVFIDQIKYIGIGKIDRQYYKNLCAKEILDNVEE